MLEIRQSKLERVGIETREQTKLKETELSEARSKHRNIEVCIITQPCSFSLL